MGLLYSREKKAVGVRGKEKLDQNDPVIPERTAERLNSDNPWGLWWATGSTPKKDAALVCSKFAAETRKKKRPRASL